jgi:hypothetical protein
VKLLAHVVPEADFKIIQEKLNVTLVFLGNTLTKRVLKSVYYVLIPLKACLEVLTVHFVQKDITSRIYMQAENLSLMSPDHSVYIAHQTHIVLQIHQSSQFMLIKDFGVILIKVQ